jgi:hypothetical protein
LTDKLTILVAPFSTLGLWLTGAKATGTIQETMAIGVAFTVLAVALLRLTIAPYWLWRDDQAEKGRMAEALADEKNRPDRYEREMAASHTIKLRAELIDALAKSVAIAEIAAIGADNARAFMPNIDSDFRDVTIKTRQLINALSYDVTLRVCAHSLAILCSNMTMIGLNGQPVGDRWTKLQSLKKIVFRVSHKKETNEQTEIIAMLEAQNIVKDEITLSEPVAKPDTAFEQLRAMLSETPELANELRKHFKQPR